MQDSEYVMPTYGRLDISFSKGEGAYLYTRSGDKYLDFMSGIAVTNLGHSHPRMVEAMKKQAETLWHVSNLYHIEGQIQAAKTLCENSFADQVFFCNSGAEANEACIKVARKYHSAKGRPQAHRIIAHRNAFHGRTLATLAMTGKAAIMEGFEPATEGFDHVDLGDLDKIKSLITEETAGIIIEPVQGEGGVNMVDAEYLQALRKICDEFNILLIFDEVQCGVGRTGKLFAHEYSGVTPDIMALAKGLGGGVPVGACLATKEAAIGMGPSTHGTTFGGQPLAMAAVNTLLDVMLEDGFMDSVNKIADYFVDSLEALAKEFSDFFESGVRGAGLMRALKAKTTNMDIVNKCMDHGLLVFVAGDNTVRFLPPLIITETHVDEAMNIMKKALTEMRQEAA